MKLADYLSENKIKRADFARRLGVSEVTITRYANGTRMPRPSVMVAIREATDGQVTPNDFVEVGEQTSPFSVAGGAP